jgi:hypothetical protein
LELPGFVLKSIGPVLIRKKSFLGFKVDPLSSTQFPFIFHGQQLGFASFHL